MKGGDARFDMQDYLINWNAGPFGLVLRPDLGSDMPPCVAALLPEQSVAKLSGVRAGDMLISVNGKKTTKLGYEKVVKMLYKESLPLVLHFRTPKAQPPSQQLQQQLLLGPSARSDSVHGTMLDEPRQRSASSQQPSMALAAYSAPAAHQYYQQQQQMMQLQLQRRPTADYDTRSVVSTSSSRALPRVDPKSERKQFTAVWERGSLGISFRAYSPRVNVPCVDFIGKRGQGRNMDRVCLNDVLIAINGEKTKALGVERVLRWLLVIETPVVLRFHSSSNRVPQGPADSIDGYQPEREPLSLVSPPPPPLRVLYEAPHQQQQQADVRRQTNQSINSNASQPSNQPQQYENRYNPAPGLNDFDLLVNAKPELRRHQSNSTEYSRSDRPRVFSNGALLHGAIPQPPPMQREEQQPPPEPVTHHAVNNRVLYEPHEQPREPELERPRQRRYSNAQNTIPSREQQERYTRATTTPASYQHAPPPSPQRRDGISVPKSDEMSLDDAIRVVVRSSGKPVGECTFAGGPILAIREGSVQAKLLITFAKACLAKETAQQAAARDDPPSVRSNASPTDVMAGDFTRDPAPEPQRFTTGNALGRHNSHQFLSYGAAQGHEERTRSQSSDAVAMPMLPASRAPNQHLQAQVIAVVPPPPPIVTSVDVDPPAVQQRDRTVDASAPAAAQLPSEDFISLKDYLVQDEGQVADRETTSSINSASTHVQSLHSEDDLLAAGSHLVAHPVAPTPGVASSSSKQGVDETEGSELSAARLDSNSQGERDAPERHTLNITDLGVMAEVVAEESKPASDMISLDDATQFVSSTDGVPETEQRKGRLSASFDPVQREIDEMTHIERSSLLHPLIAEMYGFLPDLHNIVKDKPVDTLLMKKGMVDEIQDILQSLQMEEQFERHSHVGIGSLPPPLHAMDLSTESTLHPSGKQRCYQCGKTGELADLALDGGRRELYCQDCWEVFFYSEDQLQEGDSEASATPRSMRDSADDAYKYSFHDSSASRSDMMVGPWRYLNGGDSASSIRDSTTTIGSSVTDRADEVWL